jgi:hypothetical protein
LEVKSKEYSDRNANKKSGVRITDKLEEIDPNAKNDYAEKKFSPEFERNLKT